MDVQGAAQGFPRPGEILVDASGLTLQEKALMLYRHAKCSLVSPNLKSFIQTHASEIVFHHAFTPERIRRFVAEAVSQLVGDSCTQSDPGALSAKIRQEIENPTDRMRKCFHALPLPHKWMLLSLLESGHYSTTEDVVSTYRAQYGDGAGKPSEILDELTEAFVAIKRTTRRYVEWIHPSYRDLVIEQLRDGGSLKSEFLNRMSISGIKLALSDTGGSTGRLRFPLISSANDWDTLQRRALEVARSSGVEHSSALLTVLASALDGSIGQDRSSLLTILKATCRVVREKWDSGQVALSASAINAYAAASERTSPMEPMPALEATWQATLHALAQQVNDEDSDFLFEFSALDEFLSLVDEIRQSEPRFLRHLKFPGALEGEFDALLSRIDRELEFRRSYHPEADGYDSEANASFGLAASLRRLHQAVPTTEEAVKPRLTNLTLNANRCRQRYEELEAEASEGNGGPDVDEDYHVRSTEGFDVNSMFVDL
jgi:hypothetical protein